MKIHVVWLTSHIVGFGWTCRLIALISLIFGSTGFWLLETRLPRKPPGPFFHFQAFKSLPYCLLTIGSFVSSLLAIDV